MDPAALGTLIIGLDHVRAEQSDEPRRHGVDDRARQRSDMPFRVAIAAALRSARRPPRAANYPGSAGLIRRAPSGAGSRVRRNRRRSLVLGEATRTARNSAVWTRTMVAPLATSSQNDR